MAAVRSDRIGPPAGLDERRVLAWPRSRGRDALAGRVVWCAAALPGGHAAGRRCPMGRSEPTETAETADRDGAYPRLSEGQLEVLAARGRRSRTTVGEGLYRQGESPYAFFVIPQGLVSAPPHSE